MTVEAPRRYCQRRDKYPFLCVNTADTAFAYLGLMTDSLDRLYRKVLAARDADAPTSRTAKLFRRGRSHMAKKLGEEAVEVVIDAITGDSDAVVRESADLLYNLVVLWTACGLRPSDIWAEMERRERLLGIAEKLPKSDKALDKQVKTVRPDAMTRPTVPPRRLRGVG